MAVGADTLKRTPLYDRHVAAGAKLVPFAGWEMPVQYTGIREEHVTVRQRAGIFDVSHMGEIETSGPDAEAFLQRILSNDVSKLAEGGAQYSVLCRDDGGVLDDLFSYKLDHDRYLTVTNASNHEKDLAWFQRHAEGFDVMNASEFDLDLHEIAGIWRYGSVVRSWLLELLHAALEAEGNDLKHIAGYVEDSGAGRWTVFEAINESVPAPVISAALFARFASREDESFAAKINAALRNQFGGHAVRSE